MKSKKKGKTNVFACTKCSLRASKDHLGEMLLSSTLSMSKYLHCHRMVPDGYRSGEMEEVFFLFLTCIFNIRCHYKSWRRSVRLFTLMYSNVKKNLEISHVFQGQWMPCSKHFFTFTWRYRWKRRKHNQDAGYFNVHSIKESSYVNLTQGWESMSSEGKLYQPFCDAM